MERFEKYAPLITMCVVSISMVLLNKLWTKDATVKKSDTTASSKPQKKFRKFVRNNLKDNTGEFYSTQDLEKIKKKIEELDISKLLEALPGAILKPFREDDFIFVTEEKDLERMSSDILNNSKAIGIDIEQTNLDSYQGFNCLIQISTLDKNYIIDAIELHDVLPQYLKPVFENENIVKIFCSGVSDLQWLNRDYGLFVVNFFDVHYTSLFLEKRKDCSLVGLLDTYCNHKLDKETKKKFQISDWRKRPLTRDQLNYAILDAHYLIYLRNVVLEKLKQNKKPDAIESFIKQMQANCVKPYEPKVFNRLNFVDHFNHEIASFIKTNKIEKDRKAEWSKERKIFVSLCKLRDDISREIDTNPDNVFSLKSMLEVAVELPEQLTPEELIRKLNAVEDNLSEVQKYCHQVNAIINGENLMSFTEDMETKRGNIAKQEEKTARRQVHEERFTMKKNLYENCQVLAPDGEVLCFTNKKKIDWYISKGIAEVIREDPPIIKLKFEPSGRGGSDMQELNVDSQSYTKRGRVNQCVVCGKQEKLSRYHVVPVIYRDHFPADFKSHRGYDVLLMCFRCREKANYEADKYKIEVAKTFDVPLVEFDKPKQLQLAFDSIQKNLPSYVKFKQVMPAERKTKLKEGIRKEFVTLSTSPVLSDFGKQQLEALTYKEDGRVKFDQKFIDFFANVKDFKLLIQKVSSKDFKNITGKLVVEKLGTVEDLKKFINDWRMLFLQTMDPQFLPNDWRIALAQIAKQRTNVK